MDDSPESPALSWSDEKRVADNAISGAGTHDKGQPGKPWRGRLIALMSLMVALTIIVTVVIVHNNAGKTHVRTAPPLSQAQMLQAALLTSGILTWGSDATLGAPAAFVDPAHPQAITGFDADLVAALAQHLQLQTHFAPVAWAAFPQSLQAHAIDIFADDVVTTDVPTNDATFSSPYLITSTAIVVRTGDTRFTNLKSLEGYPVGVLNGDRGVTLAQTDKQLRVQRFDLSLPFEALASGRIDAVIISSPLAQWYGARDSLKRFMVLTQEYNLASVALALAVNGAHSRDLKNILSQTLHAMAQDGSLAQIMQHWGMTDALQQCIIAPTKAQGCPAP